MKLEGTTAKKKELEAGKRGRCTVSGQEPKTGLQGVRWCRHCKTRWIRDVQHPAGFPGHGAAPPPTRADAFKHAGALDGI